MSHIDGQPYEVPEREVIHDDGGESDPMYPDFWPGHVGTIREREWWGSQEQLDEFDADLERRDEARKRLGGFGFGARP